MDRVHHNLIKDKEMADMRRENEKLHQDLEKSQEYLRINDRDLGFYLEGESDMMHIQDPASRSAHPNIITTIGIYKGATVTVKRPNPKNPGRRPNPKNPAN